MRGERVGAIASLALLVAACGPPPTDQGEPALIAAGKGDPLTACAGTLAALRQTLSLANRDHREMLPLRTATALRRAFGTLIDEVQFYRQVPSGQMLGASGINLGHRIFVSASVDDGRRQPGDARSSAWFATVTHELLHSVQMRCLGSTALFAVRYCSQAALSGYHYERIPLERAARGIADALLGCVWGERCAAERLEISCEDALGARP
ncbi:MAG: hypothetical protein H6707_20420 [Deltaproteobacteria bacterium]|nr:hypothetical protein [Deltaproteobacteria bacterium]